MMHSNIFPTILFRDLRQSCMTIRVRSVGDNVSKCSYVFGATEIDDPQKTMTCRYITLGKKNAIHQVTTMLATSKNVLFPGHNHQC